MDEYVEFRDIKPFRMIIYGVKEIMEEIGLKDKL
jgi:hypothetical protein